MENQGIKMENGGSEWKKWGQVSKLKVVGQDGKSGDQNALFWGEGKGILQDCKNPHVYRKIDCLLTNKQYAHEFDIHKMQAA